MPVGALALLPFYARITATLAQVFPDIAQGGLGCRGWGRGWMGVGAEALLSFGCLVRFLPPTLAVSPYAPLCLLPQSHPTHPTHL